MHRAARNLGARGSLSARKAEFGAKVPGEHPAFPLESHGSSSSSPCWELTGIRGEPPKGRSIKKRAPKLQEHQKMNLPESVNTNKNSEGCAGCHRIVPTPSLLITCQHR